ncbi:MAG: SpoIIE family protein phosphatase [Bacteroidetes bacterium]|nr:SpoIIE family protein phosphatase [Bacteroidota bacterium]
MAPLKDVEIDSKKSSVALVLIPSLLLTFNFLKNIYNEIVENGSFSFESLFIVIMNLFLTSVFAYLSLIALKKYTKKGPGLIINKLGILDNSGLVSAGMIFWQDIIEINSTKILFSECITVKVKNPDRYIKNQRTLFKRSWLEYEYKNYGSPVNISVSGLKIKFKDLFSIVQQHFLSTHVESRTLDLKREKEVIQTEKKALVDSINYAKRIQTALLPSQQKIEEHLGENFILFLPKDIVSGDFYWVETSEDWVLFAGCDCTGHGVPGALISILCINALSRAVNEYGLVKPSLILDKVAEIIVDSLGISGEVKDGMEASLCAFNRKTRELYWSGANCPLWIAREGAVYELMEFKPDKQPIGQVVNRFPYTNHKIHIEKGDVIYLFSDGYADQFGGELGKKLTRKKFKEIVMLQRGKSLKEQQDNFLRFHNEYKGRMDQIDDILLMGIKVER